MELFWSLICVGLYLLLVSILIRPWVRRHVEREMEETFQRERKRWENEVSP